MSYEDLAMLVASITGIATLTLLGLAQASWRTCSLLEKTIDVAIIASMAALFSSFAYFVVLLHDPARAAAFNPCDHPAPHKRPSGCQK